MIEVQMVKNISALYQEIFINKSSTEKNTQIYLIFTSLSPGWIVQSIWLL
jgi:hypothetical protein